MPIPNYNQDVTFWCELTFSDINEYDEACDYVSKKIKICKQCSMCMKQSYSLVVQDESQKKFISPGGVSDT